MAEQAGRKHKATASSSAKKRLRGAENSHFSARSDFFDFVNDPLLKEDAHSLQVGVISSWLANPLWLSFQDISASEMNQVDDLHVKAIQQEISSLSQQLTLAKRRLMPAAELCAERNQTNARKAFNEARNYCNPFEILGEKRRNRGLAGMFMNRAAVKLANLDALLHFDLTKSSYHGHEVGGPFVFVDLCGAPGGFSEYIIRRCQMWGIPAVFGYGMSLIGSNEYGEATPWRLNSSAYLENTCLRQYRIFEGADGTGDVFVWENVESLLQLMSSDCYRLWNNGCNLMECCEENSQGMQRGKAHLVMADGGFDAQRDSECQEQVSQKLIVCEVAAALTLLRPGGTLVIKMFGFQTPILRAILEDLTTSKFQNVIALKPVSSRPASAERYVVCRGFRGLLSDWKGGPAWRNQIFLANHKGNKAVDSYFDTMDRDMLRLNLKSCFAILTYLENKQTPGFDQDEEDDDSTPAWLNLGAYRQAWLLA